MTLTMQRLCSILLFIFTSLKTLTSETGEEIPRASIIGNVTLGGLFPLHLRGKTGTCSVFNSLRAMQEMEAMLFSIDQINANETLLPNLKLGVNAFDTCSEATSALNSALKEFVLGKNWNSDKHCVDDEMQVIGVIGPAYSYEAVHIAPYLNLFEIPLISYSATSPELSEKDKFEYFSRTAASDIFQISAILDLLIYFNWTYISILYTDDSYGQAGYEGITKGAQKRGIYFANKIVVPQKSDELKYKEIVDDVLSAPQATVIILFGLDSVLETIFYMIQEHSGNRSLQFVVSDALASAISEELNKVQRITQQVFFFNLPTGRVDGFTEYFLNLSVRENKRNPWFKNFFAMFTNCTSDMPGHHEILTSNKPKCEPSQTLGSSNYSTEIKNFTEGVSRVVDAVYAFAHALNYFLQESQCQKNTSQDCAVALNKIPGDQLLSVLRTQAFWSPSRSMVKFTKAGDVMGVYDIFYNGQVGGEKFEYFKVGQWTGQKLQFEHSIWKEQFIPLNSTCETVCEVNQYRKKRWKTPWKCWKCRDCPDGSYAENETVCHWCPKGKKPDIVRQLCAEIIPVYLAVDGKVVPLSVVVLPIVFASIGLVAVTFVFGIFVKYWNTPIVKASGRELSTLLLLGILMAFLFPFVVISRPSPIKCFWQFVLGSLPFTVCFVAIAVKNNRTYRIFNPKRVITAPPPLIRPKSQILVSLGLITFQLILLSALLSLDFPRDEFIYSDSDTINHVCRTPRQMFLSYLYNALLLIACTYYGYKTKNIPRNFNEAKHIAFAMYGGCVSMVAFGIVFLLNSQYSNDYGVVIQMMYTEFVAFIIMLCFFAPKIYIILYRPDENANNASMATNAVIGTDVDINNTRDHQRSHNQLTTNGIAFEEPSTKEAPRVESSDTNITMSK